LPILGAQRQVVRWAFEEGRQALDVKRFALSTGGYIIVQVVDIKAAGLPDAGELKTTVSSLVMNEKKEAALLKQIKDYETLEEVAAQFDQTVNTAKAVNRFTSMLAGASNEPEVVGFAFGMDVDTVSEPIGGNTGLYVIQLKAKKAADSLSNYAGYKASILNAAKQNVQMTTANAVKNTFEVTDNRSLYY